MILYLCIFALIIILLLDNNIENLYFNADYLKKKYKENNIKYDNINNKFINVNNYKIYADFNSSVGIYKSMYKDITNKILHRYNLPASIFYKWNKSISNEKNIQNIINKNMKFPLVVKPTNGTQGYGVYLNILTSLQIRSKIDLEHNRL